MAFSVNYLRDSNGSADAAIAEQDVWLTEDGELVPEITSGGGRRIAKAGHPVAPQWLELIESHQKKARKAPANKARKSSASKKKEKPT